VLKIARGKGRSRKLLLVCSLVLLLLGGIYLWPKLAVSTGPVVSQSKAAPKAVEPVGLTSRMLFMGDVFWGRYINDWSQASPLKTAYPFSRLGEFDRASYDAWIADQECPITNAPQVSSAQEDATLTFNCQPDYVPEEAKWFTAMTLANNHTDNQGAEAGLDQTRQNLIKNGIQFFGTFDPEDYDNICDVIAVPTRVQMSNGQEQKGHLPIAMCGYHGVFKTPSAQSLAVMQRYAKLMPVIAMPHSGQEYKPAPDEIKTTLYRSMIDNGADVVIGDHPHWVQTSEAYKGHLIVYSVGNFIFDQQYNQEVTRSAPVQLSLHLDQAHSADLTAWLALGETCNTHHDSCLATAEAKGLRKLPFQYQFGVIGSDNSGHLVHPATPSQLAALKVRLGWAQTIKGLTAPYSGQP